VAGSLEHGNEPLGFIKCGEFLQPDVKYRNNFKGYAGMDILQ
jgi:hypothetical protein